MRPLQRPDWRPSPHAWTCAAAHLPITYFIVGLGEPDPSDSPHHSFTPARRSAGPLIRGRTRA